MSVESDIKAMEKFSRSIDTKEEALEVLRKAGIVDDNGEIKNEYRDALISPQSPETQ